MTIQLTLNDHPITPVTEPPTQPAGQPTLIDEQLPPAATLTVFVAGRPAPQGSKDTFRHKHTGKPVVIENSKTVKPWRADVRAALLDDAGLPRATFDGPVCVELRFIMPRPLSTPKRRPTPPHTKKPDIDKLVRAILDACTSAGVWKDDSHVTQLSAKKRTAELGETAGCEIAIWDAP